MASHMNGKPPPINFLDELFRALNDPLTPPPTQSNAPNNFLPLILANPPRLPATDTPPSALGSIFGLGSPPLVRTQSQPRIRRVFYSFHYADVNRVNQVRQSGKIRPIDSERVKTIQDRSLWERKKSTNDEYLRRSISKNIIGTSATCILTGQHTWQRPWCRFEIARSLLNGNGIFAVRIDHLYCIGQRCYGIPGPNPLDYIAVGKDLTGRIQVYEFINDGWYVISSMTQRLLKWPNWLTPVENGYVRQLSAGAPLYDYQSGNGAQLLLHWANQAAIEAGR